MYSKHILFTIFQTLLFFVLPSSHRPTTVRASRLRYSHPSLELPPCFHRLVYHQYSSSYTYLFFEKSYFIIVLHKISCTRQFESQLSSCSFALSFRVKDWLSALLHLIRFFNIVTWKHSSVVLIPIFHNTSL